MTVHCHDCGSQLCNHGNCPRCRPCDHCDGGDKDNRYFGEDDSRFDNDDRTTLRFYPEDLA